MGYTVFSSYFSARNHIIQRLCRNFISLCIYIDIVLEVLMCFLFVILEQKEEILKKQREEKEKLKAFRETVSTTLHTGHYSKLSIFLEMPRYCWDKIMQSHISD
jgi:uncharacterized membrane protein